MLKLEDRLRVAVGNGMGVALTPDEAAAVAGWLILLRRAANHVRVTHQAREALEKAGVDFSSF